MGGEEVIEEKEREDDKPMEVEVVRRERVIRVS